MRVLIIEDNERKLNDTIEYIQKACKEELEMDHAMSVRAAKQYIKDATRQHKYYVLHHI